MASMKYLLKLATNYTAPDGTLIFEKDHLRYLGVTMSADFTFKQLTTYANQQRTSRSPDLMLTLSR